MYTSLRFKINCIILFLLTICLSTCYAQKEDKTDVEKEEAVDSTGQQGWACMYSNHLNGRRTSSGEKFSSKKLTAAHLNFPLGSEVKVTNIQTGKSVVVRINDRGPFSKKFIIDLSPAAAQKIGFSIRQGITKVRLDKV